MTSPSWLLGELAQRFALPLHGDPSIRINGVAPLARARADELGFLTSKRHLSALESSQAGAAIVTEAHLGTGHSAKLVAHDPMAAFARIAALFEPHHPGPRGVHPSAVIAADASIHPDAVIGPFCVVESGSRIDAGAELVSQVHVGPDCVVGAHCRLLPRVTLVTRVRLGQRVLIHPGAVLGSDGFGLAFDQGAWLKVPQLGGVVIGDDCEIGSNSTIDRGALDDTVLEQDVRLDNLVHIAHNVHIGAHTAIAGCAAVAGSAHIGRYCLIGGAAGILGHIEITDRVTITAMSLVSHSIREPGEYSSGTPLEQNRRWRRNAVRIKQLDELARRVARLETESKP
ncbi:MAG TPA: UDP-3-O-(3-hydroxymyristoyl)glucosamine N-acyltransferase [Rhodanobacteraceae bacterium]|nr:UDP-3-O-(3-hydroxymyristoyl)glucosamine N-acyltransferase [Rhodanobacteraceae bacterium]